MVAQDGYRYPATDVSNFSGLLGAKISAGNAFKYGRSVRQGREELKAFVTKTSAACPNTHFILAGYSQGAQVISTALPSLPSDKITYAATLGDPKLYLPEGISVEEDTLPPACVGNGINYSDYRANVPDCRVIEGVLEANVPYRPTTLKNKVGAWCNYADFMCGSKVDISNIMHGHTTYQSNGSYTEVASNIAQLVSAENILKDVSLANHTNTNQLTDVLVLVDKSNITSANLDDYNAIFAKILQNYDESTEFYSRDLWNDDRQNIITYTIEEIFATQKWRENASREILIVSSNPYLSSSETKAKIADSANNYHIAISAVTSKGSLQSYQYITSATNGSLQTAIFPAKSSSYAKYNNHTLTSTAQISNILSDSTGGNLALVIVNDAVLGFTDQTDLTITDLTPGDKVKILPIDQSGRPHAPLIYHYNGDNPDDALSVKAPNSGSN